MGALYFPTGVTAAMRDLEITNHFSQLHGTFPRTLAVTGMGTSGTTMEWTMNTLGCSPPTIPKGVVFARTFTKANLYLADSFHPLVRRGTWRRNNREWYENDVVWTKSKAQRSIRKISCKHASFSDNVVKQYNVDARFNKGNSRAKIGRKRLFEMNTRK